MYQEMEERLLATRARETGELHKFHQEAETRAKEAKADRLLSEDAAEWAKRSASLDEIQGQLEMIRQNAEGERKADEYRGEAERFVRPNLDSRDLPGDSDWAKQEKAIVDFFSAPIEEVRSGRSPNSLEISLRGLHVNNWENGRRVVRETRSLKPIAMAGLEERTGLNVGTGTAGGDLFNTSFRTVLYSYLVFNSAIRQTRATILTTGGGEPLLLPKVTAHPTSAGTITPEAVTIGESDPTFDQGTLNSYKYGNLILVSSELEQDTQVDLLGYLAMAMGRALGNSSGVHFVTGDGSSKPNGVIHAAGTIARVVGGTPAASGATFSELTQVYDKIIPGYQVNAEWFMGQPAMQKVRALTNSQGTPIFLPSLYGSEPDTLFGKPIILDPNVPSPASNATSIAFGDFSTYFIRDVGGLRFERSIDFKFDTDQVAYRALIRTDGDLLDLTGAIGVYTGGTA